MGEVFLLFKFAEAETTVTHLYIKGPVRKDKEGNKDDSCSIKSLELHVSDDAETWKPLQVVEDMASACQWSPYVVDIDSPKHGQFMKITITGNHGGDAVGIEYIRFMAGESLSDKYNKLEVSSQLY